jgi:glyoxylase-like metal-dependent hydrolase (beta-lactamase superfamily II)
MIGLVLAAAVVAAPDPARPGPHQSYETHELAPGVLAFVAPEGRTGTVQGNTLVVIGRDAVLVVDTGQFAELAARMIADIRKRTDRPVRWVVNTHWHGDHLLGNAAFVDAFPGVSIVNHVETRRLSDKSYEGFAAKAAKEFPQYVTDMRAAVARGTRKSGALLTAEDKEYYARQADEIEAFLRQLPAMRYVRADAMFDRELRVDLGGREVRILHLGRGNTGGDTVVLVPDAKVVAAGDLVVYPTPYSFGSWLAEWPDTLAQVEALGATSIVHGHGPVLRDHAYIHTVAALVRETRRQVGVLVKEGLSLEETRKRVTLDDYRKTLAADDYWRRRAFDEFFLQPAVEQAYKEAKGQPMEEGTDG